jgi:hypothetical protein
MHGVCDYRLTHAVAYILFKATEIFKTGVIERNEIAVRTYVSISYVRRLMFGIPYASFCTAHTEQAAYLTLRTLKGLYFHLFLFRLRKIFAKKVRSSLKPSGYCTYLQPGLTFTNSMFCPHSVFMCFVWISEQIAIISLYSIN